MKLPQHVYRDITIRGVRYASVREAALALGCSLETVRAGLRSGQNDRIGLGRNHACQVVVRGQVFENQPAVAAHFGFSTSYVGSLVKKGKIDSIGMRGARRPADLARIREMHERGLSAAEIARQMGVDRATVRRRAGDMGLKFVTKGYKLPPKSEWRLKKAQEYQAVRRAAEAEAAAAGGVQARSLRPCRRQRLPEDLGAHHPAALVDEVRACGRSYAGWRGISARFGVPVTRVQQIYHQIAAGVI